MYHKKDTTSLYFSDASTTATEMEPNRRNGKDVIKSQPVTENSPQALVRADTEAALRSTIQFWAEGSTRGETFERASKIRDKMQVDRGFFAFTGKHSNEVTPEDVLACREDLESKGQRPATV